MHLDWSWQTYKTIRHWFNTRLLCGVQERSWIKRMTNTKKPTTLVTIPANFNFKSISNQFQINFKSISNQFQINFNWISIQFQLNRIEIELNLAIDWSVSVTCLLIIWVNSISIEFQLNFNWISIEFPFNFNYM